MDGSYLHLDPSHHSSVGISERSDRPLAPLLKNPKEITFIVMGIVAVLGGIFFLLAAYNVLPHGVNAISQLDIGKGLGGIIIELGIFSMSFGLACWFRNNKASLMVEEADSHRSVRSSEVTEPSVLNAPKIDSGAETANNNLLPWNEPLHSLEDTGIIEIKGIQIVNNKTADTLDTSKKSLLITNPSLIEEISSSLIEEISSVSSKNKNDGNITQVFESLEITEFNSSNLLPTLPLEIVAGICSWLDSRAASVLACVAKDWNFYVNQGYENEIKQIASSYNQCFPYINEAQKRYSTLSCLALIFEDRLYKQGSLNKLYSLYHVEVTSMINHWGTVRAIMEHPHTNVWGEWNEWCFVVDFHRSISLQSSRESGIQSQSIYEPIEVKSLHPSARGSGLSKRFLSQRRIAFKLNILTNDLIWIYASYIDDPRVQALEKQKCQALENGDSVLVQDEFRKKYLLFNQEDCLSFTLQVVKNYGKRILSNGFFLVQWEKEACGGFFLKEIVEDYVNETWGWKVTYQDKEFSELSFN